MNHTEELREEIMELILDKCGDIAFGYTEYKISDYKDNILRPIAVKILAKLRDLGYQKIKANKAARFNYCKPIGGSRL